MKKFFEMFLFTFFALSASITFAAEQIPYQFVSIDEYLATPEKFQVVDVRSVTSRTNNGKEVAGEIWINPHKKKAIDDFVSTQDKNLAYLIYCSCLDDGYSIRAAQILYRNDFKNVFVLKDGSECIKSGKLPMVEISKCLLAKNFS